MKRLAIIVVVAVVLIAGGSLTARKASVPDASPLPGLIRSTSNPEASVMDMLPWKAEQLVFMIGFVLFNLVGMALTITVVMWFVDRQVRRAKKSAPASQAATSGGDA
ncbi:MAG: hypothetical protein K8I60_00810 [Anaerolineae bacterium]|nr:hypothetical protein [Anaerolineae bacterium]